MNACVSVRVFSTPLSLKAQKIEARRALKSAFGSQPSGELRYSPLGQPQLFPASNGYVSLSHKSEVVAGAVAPYRIGIDLEIQQVRRHLPLLNVVATPAEWTFLGESPNWDTFFKFWTAKEAIVKAVGVGLRMRVGLKETVLTDYTKDYWVFERQNSLWHVFFLTIKDHVLAVARPEGLNMVAPKVAILRDERHVSHCS